ncbi:6914_t:CDS:2, partial [Ambispora leptoticha]
KANSTSLTETYNNNLYQGTFMMGQTGNNHTSFRITENEAVKLITRTVKEIGKIKKTEFDAYVNGAGKSTLADVDNTIKGTTLDENGNRIEHPDKGKPANGHRIEYSFGDDYTKKDGNPVATNNFTHTELKQLFNLAKLFSDHNWTSALKAILTTTAILTSMPLTTAPELAMARNIAPSNTVETVNLNSFTNDPIKQLFADLRSYDTTSSTATDKGGTGTESTPNYDIFTDGTNHFTYQEFPEFYLDEESRLESLQVNKDLITEEIKAGRKELDQAEKDYQTARKQLFAKEKELDDKITTKITDLRKELKEKYKVVCIEKDGKVEKVNDDFLAFLKGKDAELTNLEKLIEKKEPKEVILLIHHELGGKKEVDNYELTEEDKKAGGNFEKFLYQTAIGKINESALTKPTEENGGNGTPTIDDPK